MAVIPIVCVCVLEHDHTACVGNQRSASDLPPVGFSESTDLTRDLKMIDIQNF